MTNVKLLHNARWHFIGKLLTLLVSYI